MVPATELPAACLRREAFSPSDLPTKVHPMSSLIAPTDNELDTIFTPPSYEQWQASVLSGLPAGSTLDALQHRTLDGLDIQVLYHDSPMATQSNAPSVTSDDGNNTWDNRLAITDTRDTALANRHLHEGLRGGNTSVELHVQKTTDIRALLKDVMLDLAPVSFRAGHDYAAMAEPFLALVGQSSLTTETLRCSFNADPLGQWLQTGIEPDSLDSAFEAMARFSKDITASLAGARTVLVDTTLHHNAGASSAQELHAAIATGTLYLTHLLDAGMSLEAASRCVVFQMACDSDVLMGTVKLRSLTRLWEHVLQQFGSRPAAGVAINPVAAPVMVAETSRRYLSRLDPWNNHLRNIAAASAAAMGGAATIIVHPHDRIGTWQSSADLATGSRMARNLPIILERESGVTYVKDPMAGSYAVETLTTQLTDLTWQALAEMGDTDAWLATIRSGQWQERLAETRRLRAARLTDDKQVIVGVNRYVNKADTDVGSAPGDSSSPSGQNQFPTNALRPVRDAEPFEQQLAATPGDQA